MYPSISNEPRRIPVKQVSEEKISVKKSEIEGKGLFAAQPVREGEQLFLITGNFTSHPYSPDFAKQGPDWIGASACKWLVPDEDNPIVYLNHSCTPNCFINEEFGVVTMRPIEKGEELFIDYSTTEIDPHWELDCTCKAENCRKKIKAFQYLPRITQVKYLRYIPMRLFNFIPKS